MYGTLKFDTEDIYYAPQYRIDDIPGWLADIMTEVGIRGSFCVFGEKARTLKDRRREDVLTKMARHDLVSHQQGNCRPLIPEILQDKGWSEGMSAMGQYEDQVNADFRRAFGREAVGLSRHNLYWAPQHVAVGGQRGLPYMTGVVGIPGSQQPLWYAGTLNLPSADSPGFGGFDEIYSCDDAFERRMKQLDGFLADCARRGVEYVSIFGCHPVRVMARGWIEEYCLVNGLTRTPEELGWLYAVKTPQEEAAAKANFRRLCQYLKGHPDLKMVGVEEAAKAFSSQPEDISRDELTAYADQVEQAGRAVLDRTFSPAEMVCGLADSLVHAEEHGDLPDAVGRRNVLGPTSLPVAGMEVYALSGEELVELARQTRAAVQSTGHLPANVNVPAGRVGLGQLAVMLARSYAALARYEKLQAVRVPKTTRYPDAAMTIDAWVRRSLGEHWPYALDFNCDRIAEHARLQTWTLKPAWLRPPRGAPYSEGRISIHK